MDELFSKIKNLIYCKWIKNETQIIHLFLFTFAIIKGQKNL